MTVFTFPSLSGASTSFFFELVLQGEDGGVSCNELRLDLCNPILQILILVDFSILLLFKLFALLSLYITLVLVLVASSPRFYKFFDQTSLYRWVGIDLLYKIVVLL